MKMNELHLFRAPPSNTITKLKLGVLLRGGRQDLVNLFKRYNGIYFTDNAHTANAYGEEDTHTYYNLDELGTLAVFDFWGDDPYTYDLARWVYDRPEAPDLHGSDSACDYAASMFITGRAKMVQFLLSQGIDVIQNQDMYLVITPKVLSLKPTGHPNEAN